MINALNLMRWVSCKSAAIAMLIALGSVQSVTDLKAADISPALADVIKAASAEKKLRLTWSDDTLGGNVGIQEIMAGLNKMYGTKIEAEYAPSPVPMDQVGNQLMAESKAGRSARVDALLTSSSSAGRLARGDFLLPVDWKALMPNRITPQMMEADGQVLRFVTYIAGITYNTKLLPNPPKDLAGFLDPKFKGRLASTPSASAFDVLGSTDFWGPQKTIDYAKALSGQISGLMRCSEPERVASGEFLALLFDCGGLVAARLQEQGAPIAQLIVPEFVQQRYFYFGIPKNATQVNAAKLFITYMMTEEGQKLAWKHWWSDLHMLPGSKTAKQLQEAHVDLANAKDIGIDWLDAHPEGDEAKREIVKILR